MTKVLNRAIRGDPNANVLINSDFRINQRAYVSAATLSAGAYAHDRWKAGASGGDYSFTQLASSTQITIAASKSLIQVVEDKNVVGGAYTLSWEGTAQARFGVNSATPSGAYASSPITVSGQTAGTVMSVEFNTGTLGRVKLENGLAATPFAMPNSEYELFLARKYCQLVNILVTTSGAFSQQVSFQPMRVSPTIAASAGTAGATFNVVVNNQVYQTANSSSASVATLRLDAEL